MTDRTQQLLDQLRLQCDLPSTVATIDQLETHIIRLEKSLSDKDEALVNVLAELRIARSRMSEGEEALRQAQAAFAGLTVFDHELA